MKKILSFVLLAGIVLLTFNFSTVKIVSGEPRDTFDHNDLVKDFNAEQSRTTYPYSELRSLFSSLDNGNREVNLTNELNGMKIAIETSRDLYEWSQDLNYANNNISLEMKQALAKNDYVLTNDLDYSIMRSSRFMPIGFHVDQDTLEFSGTFDGQGFEIFELYFESYSNYNFQENEIVYVHSFYFSMFNTNLGTIKNLGLLNPIVDLENEHVNLANFAYLVGQNKGLVENVYIEDNRSAGEAGIRALATKTQNPKRAAAIVNTNAANGILRNAYFAGNSVVNSDYINAILEGPVYYENQGVVNNIGFDSSIYGVGLTNFTGNGINQNGLPTNVLQNADSSIGSNWYAYSQDGYPKLFGLEVLDSKYQINDSIEFLYFIKMINLNSSGINGLTYAELDYVVNNDLNLNDLAPNAIKTVEKEFAGSLTGLNNNIQINNLTFNEGIIIGNNYYMGLFSVLTGEVKNLKFNNYLIKPTFNVNLVTQTFKVGIIAGESSGTIEGLSLKGSVDFTDSNFILGSYIVGSLVGEASGTIRRIYVDSSSIIDFGTKTYQQTELLANNLYVGGVLGKTNNSRLTLYNVLNEGSINTLTSNNIYTGNSNAINLYTGGIVGFVENFAGGRNQLGLLTNKGMITNNSVNASNTINQYLGGVIGYSTGLMYEFSNLYGLFRNEGTFINPNTLNKNVYVAGVLNSNHTEAVEFTQIYSAADITVDRSNTYGSLLINQLSNNSLTISQAETTGNLTVINVVRSIAAAINTINNNSELNLRFVIVDGDFTITYTNQAIDSETSYAGVTLNENANYLNVSFGGNLTFNNESANTANRFIWISGITKLLQIGKVMKNTLNEGNMEITANSSDNLLVAGLINRNLSGDLHLQDNNNRPVATLGVINSINKADITVNKSGTGNTFVGGLVTLNGYNAGGASIQDATNMGNINVYNKTTGSATFSTNSDTGGMVTSLTGGVFVGGVVSTIAHGKSRIFDTSNSGDIIGIASHFVRAGGVLGSAYRLEIDQANLSGLFFSNSDDTHNDSIRMSQLANGINYGDVQAITMNIATYSVNSSSFNTTLDYRGITITSNRPNNITSIYTNTASNERPGIFSAAGGVIGYGLSTMSRMINHGNIAATDVAGGIVGATMAYNSSGGNNIVTNINTAINYGDINAIKTSHYNNIAISSERKAQESHFYSENPNIAGETFIIPQKFYVQESGVYLQHPDGSFVVDEFVRQAPEGRRGFGGIFGRLQRGASRYMTAVGGNFDFVVNMNKERDLIGRLDQVNNFTSSVTYFVFGDSKYYSAKEFDTTQAVFTGYYYTPNSLGPISNLETSFDNNNTYTLVHSYTRTGQGSGRRYHRSTTIEVDGNITLEFDYTFLRQVGNLNINYEKRHTTEISDSSFANVYPSITNQTSIIDGVQVNNNNQTVTRVVSVSFSEIEQYLQSGAGNLDAYDLIGTRNFMGTVDVPYITEEDKGVGQNDSNSYAYHDEFEMRQDSTILSNGEPITSYIYYAENDLLADQFKTTRPNGMYVLSTTAGSTFGSVLPRNINVNGFKRLKTEISNNIDYNNPSESDWLENDSRHNQFLTEFQEDLYQTTLNDKSALLEDDQLIKAKDNGVNNLSFYLQESPFTGNDIIFETNNSMIGTNREVNLEMLAAELPENALIARNYLGSSDPDYSSIEEFRAALEAFRLDNPSAKVASGNLAPDLSVTLNSGNNTTLVGTFVSYSEAAVMGSGFIGSDAYRTEYTVYIQTITNQTANPELNAIGENGTESYTTTNLQGRTINSEINLRFTDGGNKLDFGYTIDNYLELYYLDGTTEILVEDIYYDIESQPFTNNTNRYFYSDIIFSESLRSGTYRLKYKFWNNQTTQTLNINYQRTRNHNIIEMFTNSGNSYDGTNANIAFGDVSITPGTLTVNNGFSQIIDNNKAIYLDRNTYDIPFLSSFITTNTFFDITQIVITDTSTNNYKTYSLAFTLADGTIITKTISENYLVPRYFKNGINQPAIVDDVFNNHINATATREAEQTTFSLDYNMLASALNINNFVIEINGIEINSNGLLVSNPSATEITPGIPAGSIKYNLTNRLNIIVDKSVLPSIDDYELAAFYLRNGNKIPAGKINLEKLEGMSGYLNNIKFSEFVAGIEYPDIYVLDSLGNVKPGFNSNVYFRGIDYDNADVVGEKYFKIDGEVAGTPLNSYVPTNIINYLPEGAGIRVKIPTGTDTYIWSNVVTATNTEIEIYNTLASDFTVYVGEEELYYVEYQVIPEKYINDQTYSNAITYYMSVTDITYSFLAVFNIYYDDGSSVVPIYESALFEDTLVHLSINNYLVSNEGVELSADTPLELGSFPIFDQVIETRSRLNMFYHINPNTILSYTYGLGNNFSGFYHFQMDIPKGYMYTIYLNNYEDEDVLPLMATNIDNLGGYYYYINESPRTRTRYFDIVIEVDPNPIDENWGLTDYTNTWD